MRTLIKKVLPTLARLYPQNRKKDYPQLWYCMPHRWRRPKKGGYPGWLKGNRQPHLIGWWLRPMLQWICGFLTGHEISKTEWGYGGGKFADCNCRWCDHVIKVPVKENPPPNPVLETLANEMKSQDGTQTH